MRAVTVQVCDCDTTLALQKTFYQCFYNKWSEELD